MTGDEPTPEAPRRDDRRRPARSTLHDDGRGVSETIGFVVVFSIIVVSVGVIYVTGFNSVRDMQQGEQLQNAERTFEALERNFDDIEQRGAPSRAGEVNLNGGTLSVRSDSRIDVNVSGAASFNRSIPIGALAYEFDGRSVEYENGAVFRRADDRSVILTSPTFSCEDGSAVITVVTLRSPNTSVSGTNVVTVTAERRTARVLFPNATPGKSVDAVNVTVHSPNDEAWNEHLADAPGWTDPEGDGSYECTGIERVYVRQVVVAIGFLQ